MGILLRIILGLSEKDAAVSSGTDLKLFRFDRTIGAICESRVGFFPCVLFIRLFLTGIDLSKPVCVDGFRRGVLISISRAVTSVFTMRGTGNEIRFKITRETIAAAESPIIARRKVFCPTVLLISLFFHSKETSGGVSFIF